MIFDSSILIQHKIWGIFSSSLINWTRKQKSLLIDHHFCVHNFVLSLLLLSVLLAIVFFCILIFKIAITNSVVAGLVAVGVVAAGQVVKESLVRRIIHQVFQGEGSLDNVVLQQRPQPVFMAEEIEDVRFRKASKGAVGRNESSNILCKRIKSNQRKRIHIRTDACNFQHQNVLKNAIFVQSIF